MKFDFKKDLYTGELIDICFYRELLKKQKNKKNVYLSEICKYYHEKKYNKKFLLIVRDFFDFPLCPITNLPVKIIRYSGKLILGKFSEHATQKQINIWVANNNENYKKHIEEMKIIRKGKGNPMYNKTPWNKGLNKENNEIIKKISDNSSGKKIEDIHGSNSDKIRKNMSIAARRRKKHGHTGRRHTEETKNILREKTIKRIKEGKFPQTNTSIVKKVKNILNDLNIIYEEEFEYGYFCFDLKVNNILIEVNGDFGIGILIIQNLKIENHIKI